MAIQIEATATNRPTLIGLALLALAWIQVSAASHQFEHYAGDATDVCAVCLQIEQADEQLKVAAPLFSPGKQHTASAVPMPASTISRKLRLYSPRAPPSN